METSIYYATAKTRYTYDVFDADYDHTKPVLVEDGIDKLVLICLKHLKYANRRTIERYIALESKACSIEKTLKRLYEASLIEKYTVERGNARIHSIYTLSESGCRIFNQNRKKQPESLTMAMKQAALAQTMVAFAQCAGARRSQISFNKRLSNYLAPGYFRGKLQDGRFLNIVVVPVCYESLIDQLAVKLLRYEIQCQKKRRNNESWHLILACTDLRCMCETYKALTSIRELKHNDYLYVIDEVTALPNVSEWLYVCNLSPEGKVTYMNVSIDLT